MTDAERDDRPGEEQVLADMQARVDDLLDPDADDSERAMIGRLFTSFVQRLPGALHAVEQALRAGEPRALATSSHSLQGMASNIGGRRLTSVAAAIEDAARSGVLPHPADVEPQLRREAALALRVAGRLGPALVAPRAA